MNLVRCHTYETKSKVKLPTSNFTLNIPASKLAQREAVERKIASHWNRRLASFLQDCPHLKDNYAPLFLFPPLRLFTLYSNPLFLPLPTVNLLAPKFGCCLQLHRQLTPLHGMRSTSKTTKSYVRSSISSTSSSINGSI